MTSNNKTFRYHSLSKKVLDKNYEIVLVKVDEVLNYSNLLLFKINAIIDENNNILFSTISNGKKNKDTTCDIIYINCKLIDSLFVNENNYFLKFNQ